MPVDDTVTTCPSCETPLPWHAGVTRLADADADLTRLAAPLPATGGSRERELNFWMR